MATSISRSLLTVSAGALASTAAFGQVVITDNFETDTSADYTVVEASTDGTTDFAFDYVAAGIPLAPRSTAGDTLGLKLEVNLTAPAAADTRTAFHNTVVNADRYKMTADVWMNFQGASGSTEFGHVGVGGDGATANSLFTPIDGSGAFIAFTGDGGSGSDFRWFRDPANSPVGDSANTTLPNSHPSYLGHGSNGTGSFFQSLFPSPPSTIAGSPGNIWTTVEVEVDNAAGIISFSFDGNLTFQGNFAGRFDGLVSLGLHDAFSSVSSSNNFTLFDNLEVEVLPEIGTAYCAVVPNSFGTPAKLVASGSTAVADNDFTLTCVDMPFNAFGFFLASPTQDFVPNVGGGAGNLCLGQPFERGAGGAIVFSGAGRMISLPVDLTAVTPMSTSAVMAGDTLNFQTWFRDVSGGMISSNLSNGLQVTFN